MDLNNLQLWSFSFELAATKQSHRFGGEESNGIKNYEGSKQKKVKGTQKL